MTDSKVYGLIGLARRARKLISGAFAVQKCILSGKARLVLLDAGASRNTKDDFIKLCSKQGVPLRALPAGELEKLLGDAKKCAAITDENFASPLKEELSSF